MSLKYGVPALLALSLATISLPAFAGSISSVSSRSDLGANDSLDWGQLGSPGTFVANPTNVVTNSGYSATISQMPGSFAAYVQSNNWKGNFTPGDKLLYDVGNGPVAISFATPVSAFGTQVQADEPDAFAGQLQAFDASNNSLGIFAFSGVSNSNADGSAVFAGINDTTPDIAKVVISLTSATNNTYRDFAINQVSLVDGTAVPLPPSVWSGLSILGLVGGFQLVRRARLA